MTIATNMHFKRVLLSATCLLFSLNSLTLGFVLSDTVQSRNIVPINNHDAIELMRLLRKQIMADNEKKKQTQLEQQRQLEQEQQSVIFKQYLGNLAQATSILKDFHTLRY